MAKSKSTQISQDTSIKEISEVSNGVEGVYTLKEPLSQDSKLQAITTLDGTSYYYGTPDPDIDKCEIAEVSKEYLESKILEAKQLKIAELNATCDKLLLSFKSSATGAERIYDSEVEDQLNILALVAAGVDSYFRCALPDGPKENVKHTAAQMKQVFADGLKHKSVIIGICGILKAFVETQSDIDKIRTINWTWFNTETQTIQDLYDFQKANNAKTQ